MKKQGFILAMFHGAAAPDDVVLAHADVAPTPATLRQAFTLAARSRCQGRPRKSCLWQVLSGAGELTRSGTNRLAKLRTGALHYGGALSAFTLAKVLITLAIIGVIAVLSIGIYMPKIQSNVWAKQRFYVARSCL